MTQKKAQSGKRELCPQIASGGRFTVCPHAIVSSENVTILFIVLYKTLLIITRKEMMLKLKGIWMCRNNLFFFLQGKVLDVRKY